MINSLYISITGMSAFRDQLSVTSNNIANSETTGFKSSRVNFSDLLSQSITRTSTNNIGSGVRVQSIGENWTQGTISTADSTTSLAINGYGMFTLKDADSGMTYYTRDGSFKFDKTGTLVNGDGLVVQGYSVKDNGQLGSLTDIKVSYDNSPPKATTKLSTSVNLNSGAASGDTFSTTTDIYDSLGNEIPVTITYTKSSTSNEWTWAASIPSTDGSISSGSSGTLDFDSTGALVSGTNPTFTLSLTNGAASQTVTWNQYDTSGSTNGTLTQYASDSAINDQSQDGYTTGSVSSVAIDDSGYVVCSYSNGTTTRPFKVALADFNNYNGLEKTDGNLYVSTNDSGQAIMGSADTGRMGSIKSSSKELSNVDLSSELGQLIVTQTAFQACSRVFTTTNEILQTLVNLGK
ncbi:MAG: flagellar hook protein FlgE [Deltaproteobacteria bacterium]|nr:flagellar hook protein FlgE [Deltaproteobacteria bacterium]